MPFKFLKRFKQNTRKNESKSDFQIKNIETAEKEEIQQENSRLSKKELELDACCSHNEPPLLCKQSYQSPNKSEEQQKIKPAPRKDAIAIVKNREQVIEGMKVQLAVDHLKEIGLL